MPSNLITTLNNREINERIFGMIDNYIYLYHVNQYIVLPSFADSVTDSFGVSFASTTPLSRSAPIYSYQSSGPRSVQIAFDLHRDMMTQINSENSALAAVLRAQGNGDDYIDYLIKYFESIAYPVYNASEKFVDLPIVALKMGNDIFIKGVPQSPSVTYSFPLLESGRYAVVRLTLSIQEIDPYDARQIMKIGSYRNGSDSYLSTTLERWNTTTSTGRTAASLAATSKNGSIPTSPSTGVDFGGGGRKF